MLEYAAPIWSPLDVASSTRLELVQRRFTKHVAGLYCKSYDERCICLELPSLKLRRDFLTVCLVYKILHNYFNVPPESVGLTLSYNNTRSRGIKLHVPRPLCSVFKSSFMYRATTLWNSLPYNVLQSNNIANFKSAVLHHWRAEGAL